MYKDEIKKSMDTLGRDPKTLFVGYGLKYGSKGAGFLKDVDTSKIIETPVAENLMLSLAIGLSLEGYVPIVIFERMDFILNAMDALVNHLDKIETISKGEFTPKVIIRCIVGGKLKPFFTGVTHTQDYSEGISKMVRFPVLNLTDPSMIKNSYSEALSSLNSSIIVEYKDLYDLS